MTTLYIILAIVALYLLSCVRTWKRLDLLDKQLGQSPHVGTSSRNSTTPKS